MFYCGIQEKLSLLRSGRIELWHNNEKMCYGNKHKGLSLSSVRSFFRFRSLLLCIKATRGRDERVSSFLFLHLLSSHSSLFLLHFVFVISLDVSVTANSKAIECPWCMCQTSFLLCLSASTSSFSGRDSRAFFFLFFCHLATYRMKQRWRKGQFRTANGDSCRWWHSWAVQQQERAHEMRDWSYYARPCVLEARKGKVTENKAKSTYFKGSFSPPFSSDVVLRNSGNVTLKETCHFNWVTAQLITRWRIHRFRKLTEMHIDTNKNKLSID